MPTPEELEKQIKYLKIFIAIFVIFVIIIMIFHVQSMEKNKEMRRLWMYYIFMIREYITKYKYDADKTSISLRITRTAEDIGVLANSPELGDLLKRYFETIDRLLNYVQTHPSVNSPSMEMAAFGNVSGNITNLLKLDPSLMLGITNNIAQEVKASTSKQNTNSLFDGSLNNVLIIADTIS